MEEKRIKNAPQRTIVAFSIFLCLILASVYGWKWLNKQERDHGALKPLRVMLDFNERIFSKIFSNSHRSREYALDQATKKVRVNGNYGMKDTSMYSHLKIIKENGDSLIISIEDIKKLPKKDIIFDFKCIEGWNQITHWGGCSFQDFLKEYHLENWKTFNYVGMVTPDQKYYVGIDVESMLQPQTILCYEMNGKPLPLNQGAPLRLIIPVKYGVKHIKRIGTISISNTRPPDYWYERGYDYYTGL